MLELKVIIEDLERGDWGCGLELIVMRFESFIEIVFFNGDIFLEFVDFMN